MATRSSTKTVTFAHPFTLAGIKGIIPAGTYVVNSDEEMIDDLSFVAWRRVATHILLRVGGATETRPVDPADLESSLARDAAVTAP